MSYLTRGILIAVEGIDGCGKSSLIKHLHHELSSESLPVVLTREPGGSDIGSDIRALLQKSPIKPDSKAEYLLFAADRAQHFATLVLPHLEKKHLVLSDRMGDSSVAYQGYGRGLDINIIQTINAWAMCQRQPDLTIYIRVSAQLAYERIAKRNEQLTRIEQEKISFFQRVVDGYEELYKEKDNVIILDGTLSQQAVAHEGLTQVHTWLNKNAALISR